MILKAVEHIAPLRGGSQAQIMRSNNGTYFAVKFQSNPQHTRVLANEFLACRLAQRIGLRVPEPVILEVDAATIREQNIAFTLADRRMPVKPGLQFGSSLIREEQTWDWLPHSLLGRIENVQEFLGVLAFDKWTCNADGRQAVFHRGRQQRGYTATFIDFGYAFNAGEWTFPDAPLRGTYAMNEVYKGARSPEDFAPWLERIASISARELGSGEASGRTIATPRDGPPTHRRLPHFRPKSVSRVAPWAECCRTQLSCRSCTTTNHPLTARVIRVTRI